MIPYNPRDYLEPCEQYGYAKAKDLYSYLKDNVGVVDRISKLVKHVKRKENVHAVSHSPSVQQLFSTIKCSLCVGNSITIQLIRITQIEIPLGDNRLCPQSCIICADEIFYTRNNC